MQKLPDFLAPNVSYAKKLFAVERKNYVGHWMKSKQALDSGKGLVRSFFTKRINDKIKLTVTPSPVSVMTFTAPKQRKASTTTQQAISAARCWRQDQIRQHPRCMASSRRSLFGRRYNARLRRRSIAWSVPTVFRQWMTMKTCRTSAAVLRRVYDGCLRLSLACRMLH